MQANSNFVPKVADFETKLMSDKRHDCKERDYATLRVWFALQRGLSEEAIFHGFSGLEGSATRMYGSGILRWQRRLPQQDLPAGMGIEILDLEEEALDPVVQWISDKKPRAFIPRE